MPKLLENQDFGSCAQIVQMIDTGKGARREITTYVLNKEQSFVVAARLNDTYLIRVIKRWQELENQVAAPALPDFTNPAIAARAWADEVEAKEDALKLASKTNYKNEKLLEAIQELEGEHEDVTLTEAARILGLPPRKFVKAHLA